MLLICGPAGSGKTTLCDRLLNEFENLSRIITATTRQPREDEVDGKDYYFFSKSDFLEKMKEDAFYEYALVHGRHYGTLKSEVHRQLESGNDIILNIDVQGAATFRKKAQKDEFLASKLITIFIRPESMNIIRERLESRATDSQEEIELRLDTARIELEMAMEHHYVLPTSTKENDYQIISSIYVAEKHRIVTNS